MDHYETLGVSPNASDGVILAAYRQLLKEVHPDVGTGDYDQLNAVKQAGEVLLSPSKRAEYDIDLAAARDDDPVDARVVRLRNLGIAGLLAASLAAIAIFFLWSSSNAADDSAASVAFVDVSAGDSWVDVVERVADCSDAEATQKAVDHLLSANPVLADVGLADVQVAAFDPTQLDGVGCVVRDRQTNSESSAAEEPVAVPDATDAESVDARVDAQVDAAADAPDADDTVGAAEPATADDDPPAPINVAPVAPLSENLDDANFTIAFQEDFREASSVDRFDWQLHHAPSFFGTPETWQGDHDLTCGPPTTTRTIHLPPVDADHNSTDVGEAAYWCAPGGDANKAHVMTSFETSGYAHLDLSPAQSFDQVARVCWDQNQNDLGRKWTQVTVVSEASFNADDQRLDYVKPSLEEGPGSTGVFLSGDDFLFVMQEGSTAVTSGEINEADYSLFTVDDKARRFTTCLTDLEDGRIHIELERLDSTEIRVMNGAMPDGPARVIFQDVSYNPTKDPSPLADPFTWHWDNLRVETR